MSRLRDSWCAILAAISAAGFVRLDLARPSHREALRGLCRMALWLCRTASLSGTECALRTLKAWLSQLRGWAMTCTPLRQRRRGLARFFVGCMRSLVDRNDRALQVSYAGRALPLGGPREIADALKDFRSRTEKESQTDPQLLDSAESWAERWAARYLAGPQLPPTWTSSSSCLDFNRSQGGLTAASTRAADFAQEELTGKECWDQLRQSIAGIPGVTDCDVDIAVREAQLRTVALTSCSLLGPEPRLEAIPVPERGLKVRIVTKAPWCLIYVGHFLRSWIFEGLRRDPRIGPGLEGDHSKLVDGLLAGGSERFVPSEKEYLLSADLTAASDLLPQDLVRAIFMGLVRGSGVSPSGEILEVGHQLMSTFSVLLPSGETFTLRTGIMMGLPLTWSMLNLVNLFWSEWAWAKSGLLPNPRLALSARAGAAPATAVCGDDLAGVWPRSVGRAYEDVARRCGAVFSQGKHYESSRYLLFTEEVYLASTVEREFTVGPLRGSLWEWIAPSVRAAAGRRPGSEVFGALKKLPCIPIRGLVRPTHLPLSGRTVPVWAALPHAVSSAAHDRESSARVRRVLKTLHPGLWAWARSHGFAVSAPVELGGFGLPSLRGRGDSCSMPRWYRYGVSSLLGSTKWRDLWDPAACWLPGLRRVTWRDMASEHAEVRLEARGVPVRTTRSPGGSFDYLGDFRVAEDLTSRFERELDVLLGVEPSETRAHLRVSPRSIAQAVRKKFGAACKRAPPKSLISARGRKSTLLDRWTAVRSARCWWTDHRSAVEGLVLNLPSQTKRLLAEALGWT